MANDAVYADLLEDSLSPLTAAGIDPDEARMNRAAAIARVTGADDTTAPFQTAQNQNPLPPGLYRRGGQALVTDDSMGGPTQPPQAQAGAVPAAVTPGGGAPTLAESNAATIRLGQADYAKASQDVQNEADQPDLGDITKNAEAQRVSAQRRQAELSNPYDKQTGKLLEEYKPTFGQRLMRGVEGFAGGGVLGVLDPKIGGAQAYGGPNKQLGIDQNQAAMQVAGADQQLAQLAAVYKAKSDRLGKVSSARKGLATTLKDVTGASTAQQNIPIEQQKADTGRAEAANNSPQAKALGKAAESEAEFQQGLAHGRQMGLTGTQLTLYAANGKIPEPRQASAEEIAAGQANNAFVRENGRQPKTLAEFAQIRAAAKGNYDVSDPTDDPKQASHDAQAKAIVADQVAKKQQFADGYRRLSNGSYTSIDGKGTPLSAQQFAEKIDRFRVDGNTKMVRHGWQVDEQGNMARVGRSGGQQDMPRSSAGAPQTMATPNPQTHPVGGSILVAPKGGGPPVQRTIMGYNPETGKPILKPLGAR